MKNKNFYCPNEYLDLLNYCILTTNLREKSESILYTICHKFFYGDGIISVKQFEALQDIAVECCYSEPEQNILRTLKCFTTTNNIN